VTWDSKTDQFVGGIELDSNLSFSSWRTMEDFLKRSVAAGYIMPFLIYALDPAFPSAFLPVGMIPTNLKYTTADLNRYLSEIIAGLLAAGVWTDRTPRPPTSRLAADARR
jgi:hypothetical protein